jgi:hypothetical protein
LGNSLYVYFTSDKSVAESGFRATYDTNSVGKNKCLWITCRHTVNLFMLITCRYTVEHEQFNLLKYVILPLCWSIFTFLCTVLYIIVFLFLILTIILPALLWFTVSDYTVDNIFKLSGFYGLFWCLFMKRRQN